MTHPRRYGMPSFIKNLARFCTALNVSEGTEADANVTNLVILQLIYVATFILRKTGTFQILVGSEE